MDIRSISSSSQPSPVVIASGEASAFLPKGSATPVETSAAVQQPAPVPTMAALTQAVASINKALEGLSQSLEFSIDSDSNRTIVKVVDQKTKEVIRQIPTEETLQIASALDHVQGLLIRQQA